jgi:hypothetical protein
MISTFRGITIVSNDEHPENASNSICLNFEFNSIEIDVSDSFSQKHSDPIISILFGIAIDELDPK